MPDRNAVLRRVTGTALGLATLAVLAGCQKEPPTHPAATRSLTATKSSPTASVPVLLDGSSRSPQSAPTATANDPPMLAPIGDKTANQLIQLIFQITAVDPEDDPVTYSATLISGPPSPMGWTFDETTGVFDWTPDCDHPPGYYTFEFCATDGFGSDCEQIVVTVTAANEPPTAVPGGPYQGTVAVPVEFNATQSIDPNGGIVSYEWDYGDGITGVGAIAQHTYQNPGTYTVKLTVTDDGPCAAQTDVAFTTAEIVQKCDAIVFRCPDSKLVNLNSSTKQCVRIEPVGGCFDLVDIDVGSIRMKFNGIEIAPAKGGVIGDANPCSNGVNDLEVCFDLSDLTTLFASLTQKTDVTVTVDGLLFGGGGFAGNVDLTVQP